MKAVVLEGVQQPLVVKDVPVPTIGRRMSSFGCRRVVCAIPICTFAEGMFVAVRREHIPTHPRP